MARSNVEEIMQQNSAASDALVYDVADVRRVLGVGRPLAYKLVKRLGRRLGRRLVVSKVVLENWLGERDARASRRNKARSTTV
jgi:hypothetical protein